MTRVSNPLPAPVTNPVPAAVLFWKPDGVTMEVCEDLLVYFESPLREQSREFKNELPSVTYSSGCPSSRCFYHDSDSRGHHAAHTAHEATALAAQSCRVSFLGKIGRSCINRGIGDGPIGVSISSRGIQDKTAYAFEYPVTKPDGAVGNLGDVRKASLKDLLTLSSLGKLALFHSWMGAAVAASEFAVPADKSDAGVPAVRFADVVAVPAKSVAAGAGAALVEANQSGRQRLVCQL